MIVLNLQFWESDKAQAMELARLVADLEPVPRTDAIFMFTARFDCTHDPETIAHVSKKFPTYTYTTKRKFEGWPNGPNQMMADSYEHLVERWRRGKLLADCVMFMEADCVPLHREWLSKLLEEYKACGKPVLGAWLKKGDANCEHINGNCIVAMNFYRKCPALMHPPSRGGWDATLAYAILPNGAPSKLIWSDYQLGQPHNPFKGDESLWRVRRYGCPQNALYGQDLNPVYLHGCKVIDGLKLARKRLIDERKD